MDVQTITVIATVALAILVPIDWKVAHSYYKAWRGGETIPYFAPTLFLIVAVAAGVTADFIVGLSAVKLRYTGEGFIPPGIGLLIVAASFIAPSIALLWLLRLLRERQA